MTIFDAYLMIDWSANSKPKKGKDSIWYYLLQRGQDPISKNPKTRHIAFEQIRCLLLTNKIRRVRTLVGFDFAYGYPKGFAAALRLQGEPWLAVWQEVSRIIDENDNRNNRFEVAAELNKRLTGSPFPFWGCPSRHENSTLSLRRLRPHCKNDLPERRITDRCPGSQPVWKLFYAGSVGSQTLLGIPYLKKLRDDPKLTSVSCVWPFETGLHRPPENALIVHAEIFPSMIRADIKEGEVRDQAQVRCLAKYFAEKDNNGELASLFAGPTDLTNEQRSQIKQEEGWILGT